MHDWDFIKEFLNNFNAIYIIYRDDILGCQFFFWWIQINTFCWHLFEINKIRIWWVDAHWKKKAMIYLIFNKFTIATIIYLYFYNFYKNFKSSIIFYSC